VTAFLHKLTTAAVCLFRSIFNPALPIMTSYESDHQKYHVDLKTKLLWYDLRGHDNQSVNACLQLTCWHHNFCLEDLVSLNTTMILKCLII